MSRPHAARFGGLMYVCVILFGIFAQLVRNTVMVHGDATKTAQKIRGSEMLFRLGIVSDLLMMISFMFLALSMYVVFKPVNKNTASLFLILALISIPIMAINLINLLFALELISSASYLKEFDRDQLYALAFVYLNLHAQGYLISQVFFALWLFPLGYLIYKSGYFPRIIGILVMIASIADLTTVFLLFLLPGNEMLTIPSDMFSIVGEFGLCLWLLLKGAKIPEVETL